MTYRAFVESTHKSPVKRRRMHSSSDAITQEVKVFNYIWMKKKKLYCPYTGYNEILFGRICRIIMAAKFENI